MTSQMDLWKEVALDQRKSHSNQAKLVVVSFRLILKLLGTCISHVLRFIIQHLVNVLIILSNRSITLIIQAILPCLLFAGKRSVIKMKGGTNVDMAPPIGGYSIMPWFYSVIIDF
jgi:hypothetical protein